MAADRQAEIAASVAALQDLGSTAPGGQRNHNDENKSRSGQQR